jgi:hypothetical protein
LFRVLFRPRSATSNKAAIPAKLTARIKDFFPAGIARSWNEKSLRAASAARRLSIVVEFQSRRDGVGLTTPVPAAASFDTRFDFHLGVP